MALFPDLGVNQKTKPEGLQNPEDEALGSVEESQAEEIAVDEQPKCPEEERHLIVLLAQESFALRGIAVGIGLEAS